MPKRVRSVWDLVAENKTKAAFNQIGGDLKRTDTAFRGLAVAGGVLAGAAVAVGAVGHASLKSADETAKLATKLGSTTEALSQLDYVAERSGVSSQALSNSLRDMQKNAAAAAKGQGEAVRALQELGINAEAFKRLKPEDQ
jgi:hypothetical protein